MKYLTAVGAVASAISAVHAICCLSDDKGWCYDGTPGTPCCAMETCNFFSCACDGECRDDSHPGVSLATDPFASSPVEEAFALADTDGSGKIKLPQYLAYLQVSEDDPAKASLTAWFNKNHDGVITPDEVTA